MVVDSSALVAILLQESGAGALAGLIAAAPRTFIGTPTLLETRIVMLNRKVDGERELDALLATNVLQPVDFTAAMLDLAADAFRRFGKGRHPAGLNYGDCFSYALSKYINQPLLCVGKDFALTDVALVAVP